MLSLTSTLFVLCIALTTSSLIGGFNQLSAAEVSVLETEDDAFILTKKVAESEFKDIYNETLGPVKAVAYQVVGGIRYRMDFDTAIGEVRIVCVTIYWLKEVKVESIIILHPNATDKASSISAKQKQNIAAQQTATEKKVYDAKGKIIIQPSKNKETETANSPVTAKTSIGTPAEATSGSKSSVPVTTASVSKTSSTAALSAQLRTNAAPVKETASPPSKPKVLN